MQSRYEAGFTACVAEVGRYLSTSSVDVIPQPSAVLPRLVNHLAGCLRRRSTCPDHRRVSTTTPPPGDYQASPAHVDRHDCHLRQQRSSSDDDDLAFSWHQASTWLQRNIIFSDALLLIVSAVMVHRIAVFLLPFRMRAHNKQTGSYSITFLTYAGLGCGATLLTVMFLCRR